VSSEKFVQAESIVTAARLILAPPTTHLIRGLQFVRAQPQCSRQLQSGERVRAQLMGRAKQGGATP